MIAIESVAKTYGGQTALAPTSMQFIEGIDHEAGEPQFVLALGDKRRTGKEALAEYQYRW